MTSINSTVAVIGYNRIDISIADEFDATSVTARKYCHAGFNKVIRKYLDRKRKGKYDTKEDTEELNEDQREWVQFRMKGDANSWKRWFEK